MTRNHPGLCSAWNCTRTVKPGWWLCVYHWLCVPMQLRSMLWDVFDNAHKREGT